MPWGGTWLGPPLRFLLCFRGCGLWLGSPGGLAALVAIEGQCPVYIVRCLSKGGAETQSWGDGAEPGLTGGVLEECWGQGGVNVAKQESVSAGFLEQGRDAVQVGEGRGWWPFSRAQREGFVSEGEVVVSSIPGRTGGMEMGWH